MRLRRRWALVLLSGLFLLAGLGYFIHLKGTEAQLLRGDPDAVATTPKLMAFAQPRGRRVFKANCAACHGAEAKGDSGKGVPNLADHDWLYGEGHVSDIEQTVNFGIRAHAPRTWNLAEMPAYATPVPSKTEKIQPLTPQDIADVTDLILYIGGAKPDGQAVARGAKIFQDRGGCYDCHSNDGGGDSAIGAPNLADHIWLYGDGSRASIFRSIAHGHHGVCPAWVTRLKPAAIREVSLYIFKISHPASSGDKQP